MFNRPINKKGRPDQAVLGQGNRRLWLSDLLKNGPSLATTPPQWTSSPLKTLTYVMKLIIIC